MEDVTQDNTSLSLFLNLDAVLKDSTPGKFVNIRQIERSGITVQ